MKDFNFTICIRRNINLLTAYIKHNNEHNKNFYIYIKEKVYSNIIIKRSSLNHDNVL